MTRAESLAWRAARFGPHQDVLGLGPRPLPRAREGFVVIEVEAAGVNLPDVLMVAGDYQVRPEPPFTPGREVVGRVVETAPGSSALLGRRVVARPSLPHGGYAEHTLARTQDLFPLDEHMDAREAATLLVTYLTAHVALHHRACVRAGESVLVLGGAGGVGSAAIQIARAAGATVLATASGPERLAVCRDLGAHVAIDRVHDDLIEVVRDASGGKGADVVIDPVGGDLFAVARRALAWAGRAVLVGFASGSPPPLKANGILLRNQSIHGLHLGPYQEHAPEVTQAAFRDLLRLHRSGGIKPLVSVVHPLGGVIDAMSAIKAGAVIGKIVIDVRTTTTPKE
ncbi:NADPH:quinone oxidoreductase family protein [Nonomuraea wenchangensis]|uniref:NADPH:quinone oxidoreductase family protein n=1 Tax=Nonomuraea wenchangensis TaxID=568860 RepID=UPI00341DE767